MNNRETELTNLLKEAIKIVHANSRNLNKDWLERARKATANKLPVNDAHRRALREVYDDLCKFNALPPYDGGSNIVAGDGYFASALGDKIKRLGLTWKEAEELSGFNAYAAQARAARETLLKLRRSA